MANLSTQNIGTNYKGMLNLGSTINTPLSTTLQAITDGDGVASPLQLATNRIALGTATGTSLLNFPDAGTTSADGISFGTGTSNLYRTNNTTIRTDGNMNIGSSLFLKNGDIQINSTGMFIFPNTLSGSQATSALSITQTLNTTGNPDIFNMDITNTASGVNTNFLSCKIGGVWQAKIDRTGKIVSKGGWEDGNGYTSYLKNATLKLYDSNTITGISSNGGFKVGQEGTTHTQNGYFSIKNFNSTNIFSLRDNLDQEVFSTSNTGNLTLFRGSVPSQYLYLTPNESTACVLVRGGGNSKPMVFSSVSQDLYLSNNYSTGLTQTQFALKSDGTFLMSSDASQAKASTAMLELQSTTRGFLPPRMTTTQVNAIATPAEGLVVFNTTISNLCVYQSGAWAKINHSPM